MGAGGHLLWGWSTKNHELVAVYSYYCNSVMYIISMIQVKGVIQALKFGCFIVGVSIIKDLMN